MAAVADDPTHIGTPYKTERTVVILG